MENTINLFGTEQYGMKLLGIFFGILIISITCIIDDIKTIKPLTKLAGQVLAAIVVVAFGVRINEFQIPFVQNVQLQEIFSIFITIVWIVGVTNAINLIDGLDGLSSGISVKNGLVWGKGSIG